MLLIDGVKYKEWIPEGPHAEEEFEKLFKEHAQEIFGEQSLYFDIKQRLETELGIRTIPDGFVVSYREPPQWRIIEAELSWHPLYDHIVNQIGRFISGIENTMTQRKIINAIDSELANNDFLRVKLKKAIGTTEVYRFLSDLISQKPILTIIIEKETPELKKALGILSYPSIDVVEFKTFVREGVGLSVHAHLFEPLYKPREEEPPLFTEWSQDELRDYLEERHKWHSLTFNYYRFLAGYRGKVTRDELINSLGKLMREPITGYSLGGVQAGITMTVTKKLGKERLDWVNEDSQEFSIREKYREAVQKLTSSLDES